MIDYTILPMKSSYDQKQTPKTRLMTDTKDIPTPEDINDQYDQYKEDLLIREKRLKLLVRFTPNDDLYDLVMSLKDHTPDLTKNSP